MRLCFCNNRVLCTCGINNGMLIVLSMATMIMMC